jgi:hypothetical protein
VIPASVLAIFALFHVLAARLGSTRGEAGLIVGAIVVFATVGVQAALFRQPPLTAVRWLGFGRPNARGVGAVADRLDGGVRGCAVSGIPHQTGALVPVSCRGSGLERRPNSVRTELIASGRDGRTRRAPSWHEPRAEGQASLAGGRSSGAECLFTSTGSVNQTLGQCPTVGFTGPPL